MKKVLSLVLAFAMILGSFGFVFANQYPDVKDTEYYSEPVNVLSGLGVIGGYPDGTFGTGKSITRAEMATMLINCLGIPVSGSAATPFSDVPASHWASGYIKYAANMGYVAGYPDGTFKPNNPVTYDQAITMIVAALGYTNEGLGGSWPGNFINAARGLGILKICKTTGDAAATREDVCCFLYKALTSPIGRTNKDGEFVATVVDTGFFGTPIYDTMIDRLGAVDYNGGAEFLVDGTEDSNINLGEYLGAVITAYANEDGEIIAIKEVVSEFVEDTVKNIKKTYSKTDAAIWNDWVDFFDNGEYAGTEKVNDFADPDTIKIAVSLKGTKEITDLYSIQAWTVTAADFAEDDVQEGINDNHKLLGEKFAEDEDGEIDMNSFVLLGRDSLADIAEDDVVYVYSNSDGIAKIEVGTETVEGKITKMPSSMDQITVGGKTYDISEAALTAGLDADLYNTMTVTKASCTFYLDYAGDIFDYEEDSDETSDGYGVLLNKWDETVKGKTSYFAEIFLSDGKSAEYEVKDATVFGTLPTAGELIKFTKSSKDVVTEVSGATDSAEDWTVSKNGVITTPNDGRKLTSSAIVFKFSGSDVDDADNYSVVAASTLFGNDTKSVDSIASSNTVKAALVKGTTGAENDDICIVAEAGDITAEGQMFTVLYQGKVQELEFQATGVYEGDWYTLTMDEDGVVTGVSPQIIPTPVVDPLVTDKKTAVSGNIFTASDNTNYDLDSDVVVYVYNDDDEWEAGTKNSMAGKTSKFDYVGLYDLDGDDAFDIVIVDLQ